MQNPLNTLYSLRSNNIVIALTGVTGSGCTAIADIMGMDFKQLQSIIRLQNDVQAYKAKGSMREERFKREYSICYSFCEHNYDREGRFKIIKYRNVLVYCTLQYIADNYQENRVSAFVNALNPLLVYGKGKPDEHELLRLNEGDIYKCGFNDDLFRQFDELRKLIDDKKNYRKNSYKLYFSQEFTQFCENFYDFLKSSNYYAKNYLVHKLACAFRGHGTPERTFREGGFDNENVFHIVGIINNIIKGAKYQDDRELTHFVIDSIRNSIELAYLRERYHSFYSVAVHNIKQELIRGLIAEKVQKKMEVSNPKIITQQVEDILNLNTTEEGIDDFENGRFYAPDIARCIAESEMHLCFRENKITKDEYYSFYYNGEQWLRFISLILHPGIVSPTRDERCMAIAYVAKFNSGCISRQVGCAIVDENYLCKSIGWNDPPAGQLPCSLRSVGELLKLESKEENYRCYSCYEQKGIVKNTGKEFRESLREAASKYVSIFSDMGINYPYCFSSRYNGYNKEKDKVNTRSLHAEENAILRLGGRVEGGQMFVTASPCVLCSKKAYQIGIKRIVFLDPYSDIAPMHIIECGDNSPALESFMGAIGETYYRLYRPYLPYKDELSILELTLGK